MDSSTNQFLTKLALNLIESYKTDTPPFLLSPGPFPSRPDFYEELNLFPQLMFPNYFPSESFDLYQIIKILQRFMKLFQQGFQYESEPNDEAKIIDILSQFPLIRDKLKKDVYAGFVADGAAKNYTQIIRSYQGFFSIMAHRLVHELYIRGLITYAREIQERVHSRTGIDINPGAIIGEYFFIDHGTGVVIGETAILGEWVSLFQGVTLGTLKFKLDEKGAVIKEYKRHPTIGNHVMIGAGAKILGNIRIGDNVKIGANTWIDFDVGDNISVFIGNHPELKIKKHKKNIKPAL